VLLGLSGGPTPWIVPVMTFSSFDKALLEEGLDFFSRPRLAGLLEKLGTEESDRVDALATILRHGSREEFEEAVAIFERALLRVERERIRAAADDEEGQRNRTPIGGPRRRRLSPAAERREQRRRSG